MCTISGSNEGRSFAANTFATASALKASAAKPYTVSVGKAAISPARNNEDASRTASFMSSSVAWMMRVSDMAGSCHRPRRIANTYFGFPSRSVIASFDP